MKASDRRVLLAGCAVFAAGSIVVLILYMAGVLSSPIEYDPQSDINALRADIQRELEIQFGEAGVVSSDELTPREICLRFDEIESEAYNDVWAELNSGDGEFVDIALPGVHPIVGYENKEECWDAGRRVIEEIREKGGFDLLQKARSSRQFMPPLKDIDSLEVPLGLMRGTVQNYRMSTLFSAIDDGDTAEQIAAIDDILSSLRALSWEPMIELRRAYHALMTRFLEDLSLLIAERRLSTDVRAHIVKELESFHPAPIAFVFRSYSILCRNDARQLSLGSDMYTTDAFTSEDAYRDFIDATFPKDRFGPAQSLPPLPDRYSGLGPIALIELLEAEWVERSKQARSDRGVRPTQRLMKQGWSVFPPEMEVDDVPGIFEVNAHDVLIAEDGLVTLHRGFMLALAIESFHDAHGRYPTALVEIGSGAESTLLIDPMFNTPFVYRSDGTSYLLYAAGLDGVDDGGRFLDDSGHSGFSMEPTMTSEGFDRLIIDAKAER